MTVGAHFRARFPSECNLCFGDIEEGDEVGYVDDDVVCDDCYQEAKEEERS